MAVASSPASAWRARNNTVEPLWSIRFELADFYSALTQYVGFRPAVAEGKTVGCRHMEGPTVLCGLTSKR